MMNTTVIEMTPADDRQAHAIFGAGYRAKEIARMDWEAIGRPKAPPALLSSEIAPERCHRTYTKFYGWLNYPALPPYVEIDGRVWFSKTIDGEHLPLVFHDELVEHINCLIPFPSGTKVVTNDYQVMIVP